MGKVSTGVRFVMYSSLHGIFLDYDDGKVVLSKNPGKHTHARTFKSKDKCRKKADQYGLDGTYRFVEVYADTFHPETNKPYASVQACANAMLPSWIATT